MVMWVCEASEVNIWAVFAVRPNGPNKFVGVILQLCGGYTTTLPLLGRTGRGPTTSEESSLPTNQSSEIFLST